jgi:hypothetical protein
MLGKMVENCGSRNSFGVASPTAGVPPIEARQDRELRIADALSCLFRRGSLLLSVARAAHALEVKENFIFNRAGLLIRRARFLLIDRKKVANYHH